MKPEDTVSQADDWHDKTTVVGLIRPCFIVQARTQGGEVIAIPIDEEVRRVAGEEVVAFARKKFIESRS